MPITTRCRRRDDTIFEDATTSITTRCLAVMTKSSSKGLGRFLTINSFTGRSCYRKANSKTVQLYARPKFPGFERGSGYSFFLYLPFQFIIYPFTWKETETISGIDPGSSEWKSGARESIPDRLSGSLVLYSHAIEVIRM
jgi:hypothetical protein